MARTADCHPEKKHVARGMCFTCYWKWHRATHKDAYRAANDRYRKRTGGRRFPAVFNRMWDEQGGKCALCDIELVRGNKTRFKACLDHCHRTGHFRGLLCDACNKALGHYERLVKLPKLQEYLNGRH